MHVGNADQLEFLVAVAVAGLALIGFIVGLMAFVRVRGISRRFAWAGKDSSVDTLPALLRAVESNQSDVEQLKAAFDAASIEARTHFKYMGIVRYNAFDGVAGQQSYSLCILDENKTGILLSNLVGTTFARAYAVEIKTGEPSRPLGDEETAALVAAMKNGKS